MDDKVGGICGIYGVWHVKRKWLVAYNLWQFVQIATYGTPCVVEPPGSLCKWHGFDGTQFYRKLA